MFEFMTIIVFILILFLRVKNFCTYFLLLSVFFFCLLRVVDVPFAILMKHFPEYTGEDQEGVAGMPLDKKSLFHKKPCKLLVR